MYNEALSSNKFFSLYSAWIRSSFYSALRPSFDRIDSKKPYTLDNLHIITWSENLSHQHKDRSNGYDGVSDKILQFDKNMNLIKTYPSQASAARNNNVSQTLISKCCSGVLNTGGGYIWRSIK